MSTVEVVDSEEALGVVAYDELARLDQRFLERGESLPGLHCYGDVNVVRRSRRNDSRDVDQVDVAGQRADEHPFDAGLRAGLLDVVKDSEVVGVN